MNDSFHYNLYSIALFVLFVGCYPVHEQDVISIADGEPPQDSVHHNTTPFTTDSIEISLNNYTPTYPARPHNGDSYNEHFVAFSDSIAPDSARLTYLSHTEWTNLPSSNHATEGATALAIARNYRENEACVWYIPTTAEARRLRTTYGWFFNQEARYLCDEGARSFSFAPGTNISTAGTKAKHYHLLLLCVVEIKVETLAE